LKNLKILYIDEIGELLPYTIHEFKKINDEYYTLHHSSLDVRRNLKKYKENTQKKYFYVITLENKILEVIYKENVVELEYVVDNVYKFKEKSKVKTLKKK